MAQAEEETSKATQPNHTFPLYMIKYESLLDEVPLFQCGMAEVLQGALAAVGARRFPG